MRPPHGLRRILRIGPQRIVVADALAEAHDGDAGGVLVVDAAVGPQFRPDHGPHMCQHLVGEFALRQLVGDFRDSAIGAALQFANTKY